MNSFVEVKSCTKVLSPLHPLPNVNASPPFDDVPGRSALSKSTTQQVKKTRKRWQYLSCCGAKFERSSIGTTASKVALTWAMSGSRFVSSCFLTVKFTNSGKFSCVTMSSRGTGDSADGTSSESSHAALQALYLPTGEVDLPHQKVSTLTLPDVFA